MVSSASPPPTIFRFAAGGFDAVDDGDLAHARVLVSDSWVVDDGRTLALPLHLSRFGDSVIATDQSLAPDLDDFLASVLGRIPIEGTWFPRVELVEPLQPRGAAGFFYRERRAPQRHRSVRLATLRSPDPRRYPTVKGPDLERLLAARTSVQSSGADEAVILSPNGFIVEGAYSALLWWRGDTLCLPDRGFARIDSVTSRSIVALATARGTDVSYETAAPADLAGLEVWAASALHGIRIATHWVDGPALAERPGRLAAWRGALDKLTRPIATLNA